MVHGVETNTRELVPVSFFFIIDSWRPGDTLFSTEDLVTSEDSQTLSFRHHPEKHEKESSTVISSTIL